MTSEEWILIGVVTAALGLIASSRLRPDVVALLVLLALGVTGLVTPEEAFSGFGRSAIITIVSLFVITEGLNATGVVQNIADRIRLLSGSSEVRLVIIVMGAGALLSLVMISIAAGAMLMPAVVQVARDANVRASKLLIPLAFGTLVGGMATYFTTANIIVSDVLQENGLGGLTMVDFLATGGLVAIAALVFMTIWGRRMLPDRESPSGSVSAAALSRSLRETYRLDDRLWEVRVPPGSRLVNMSLDRSGIGEEAGVTVVAIWRDHHAILAPAPNERLRAGDYLLTLGTEDRVRKLAEWGVSVGRNNGIKNTQHDYSVDLTEVVIPPRSNAIGKTLKELRFRNKYGLTAVALWREGRSVRTDVGLRPLQVGDAVLMVGPAQAIRALSEERDFLVLQSGHAYRPPRPHKATWATAITAVVLVATILNIIPVAVGMLAGAVAMVLTGCLSMDDAYNAVEWRVIVLIAGMLPVSIAMTKTGLASQIATVLVTALQSSGNLAVVGGLFLMTVLITQLLGGQVTALIVAPIAVTTALQTGLNPHAVGVAVAIACSAAFLTPLGHPVNILMMGPGGYTFNDFLKPGFWMTVISTVAVLVGMIVFWGIR
ncbi:MAG: SLC13 family permease [Chloroflexota bacterium]|mgnify:CR=1 FL=1|nr:MAG: SLC13 family permease [Chloroflexota bacterium]